MRAISDLIRTWLIGLRLAVLIAAMYLASFVIALVVIVALKAIGFLPDSLDNHIYWASGLLPLPYFFARNAHFVRNALPGRPPPSAS